MYSFIHQRVLSFLALLLLMLTNIQELQALKNVSPLSYTRHVRHFYSKIILQHPPLLLYLKGLITYSNGNNCYKQKVMYMFSKDSSSNFNDNDNNNNNIKKLIVDKNINIVDHAEKFEIINDPSVTISASTSSTTTAEAKVTMRMATIHDVDTILQFIKELARYEGMEDSVVATEDLLKNNLFGGNTRYLYDINYSLLII